MKELKFLEFVKDGYLDILDDGAIWRLAKKKRRGCNFTKDVRAETKSGGKGYLSVNLSIDKINYFCYAHRLVYVYFSGSIPDDLEINHKDGIKINNQPSNLEAITHIENIHHAVNIGNWICGEDRKSAILTNQNVYEIRKRLLDGEKPNIICVDYNVSQTAIYDIKAGRRWRHLK